jgi:hypothetical protein
MEQQFHVVPIKGYELTVLRPRTDYPDTADRICGPEATEFYEQHNLPVLMMLDSSYRDFTFFLFPKSKGDIAAMFKLTFGGK